MNIKEVDLFTLYEYINIHNIFVARVIENIGEAEGNARILKESGGSRPPFWPLPSWVRDDGQLQYQVSINTLFGLRFCTLFLLARSHYLQSSMSCKYFMSL